MKHGLVVLSRLKVPARNTGPGKSGTFLNKTIHHRCKDLFITKSVNGIEPLIVGKEKDDIRPLLSHSQSSNGQSV